ncbi:MAG TPA: integrase core domain-containing protein [Acidimicrobiales bacterium]|nr:integrase core domain-containing protein [Acidimicrobiales bacterium]
MKELVLKTVADAQAEGLSAVWVAGLWGVSAERVGRWRARQGRLGTLIDVAPGGHPCHGITPAEEQAIVRLAEVWGTVDRSHRKLAHRGSYTNTVWVSPSTVRRVLAAHGLVLPEGRPREKAEKKPWPDWLQWQPNRIWGWDVTHFPRAKRCVFAILDMVSRKWMDTLVSVEETSTQVKVVFGHALMAEGLIDLVTAERLELAADDPDRPILLAVSDNGPQMTSHDTRAFMAAMAVAQHHGRPHTPTDQAWIETLFGHVKGEWPHLETITDPAVLDVELARVRHEYNTVRLHAGIGYVTPDDEHSGRGEQIREARRQGLARAVQKRLEYHRRNKTQSEENRP